ncbi:hypothetical protein AKO1_005820 [Acrasis kona]|uniref:Uncharacterized protein n=1 Tax=Acrasis kona TaxID=1008807 RepID=A0AAW2YK53_9EUKA
MSGQDESGERLKYFIDLTNNARTNYDYKLGYKDISEVDPNAFAMEQHSHKVFSQRLADCRWRCEQHPMILGALITTAGLMAYKKHKHTPGMILPIVTTLYSWLYHHDLAHGNMINRVNQECQHIIIEEGKSRYFLTDDEFTSKVTSKIHENSNKTNL